MPFNLFRILAIISALTLAGCFVFWSSHKRDKDEAGKASESKSDVKASPETEPRDGDPKPSKGTEERDKPDEAPPLIQSTKIGSVFQPADIPIRLEKFDPATFGKPTPLPTPTPKPAPDQVPLIPSPKSGGIIAAQDIKPIRPMIAGSKSLILPPFIKLDNPTPTPTPTPAAGKR